MTNSHSNHPLQITLSDLLKWRVYEEAKQLYLDIFPHRAIQTHRCQYPEDWNEKANREYHVYCGMEKLLKQIARHRRIKGFKPMPYQIYHVISGRLNYEDLLYAKKTN